MVTIWTILSFENFGNLGNFGKAGNFGKDNR